MRLRKEEDQQYWEKFDQMSEELEEGKEEYHKMEEYHDVKVDDAGGDPEQTEAKPSSFPPRLHQKS